MRIDQLIYLVEVSKYKSISLAAEHLHITQPTISQALNALEAELNVKLLNRSRHGTIPTDDGKLIINKAIQILEKIDEIHNIAGNQTKLLSGTLSIAALPSFSMNILSNTIATFKSSYPGITVNVFEEISSIIAAEVSAERVVLGFVAIDSEEGLFINTDIIFEKLIEGHVMACVGRKSPLSACEEISYKEIVKYPIVSFISKSPFYKKLISNLSQYGEPTFLFNAALTNQGTGKQILAEGTGISFVSSLIIESDPYFKSNQLVAIPISDKGINIDYGYIRLKSRQLPPAAKEFLKHLKLSLSNIKENSDNKYMTDIKNEKFV